MSVSTNADRNRAGLVPKHVFDIAQKDNKNAKYTKMGRLAIFKSTHGFILAATTIAQVVAEESGRSEIRPEDLITAMDRLGMTSISEELQQELARNPIPKEQKDTSKKPSPKKRSKKAATKPASRTAAKRKKT
eukprot:TRINITY_DN8015_c0_g1_i1.p1 TRINITY_DN8015_c0_g1~~TRINITY_DN8015_c0_g1_i1.p1  ORF type:complete len:133 (+),score=30.67 TRINITY_DN8015_c0_g1_i1:186-584(+)